MKPTIYLIVVVSALWLVWSGHYTPLLLGLGAVSVLLVVVLCHQMRIVDVELAPLHFSSRAVLYLPWLAVEVLKSNLDVARLVMHPSQPISPRVVRVKATQPSALGRVTYANSITLTPGTLTIEAEDDILTVHALSREGADEIASGRMDRKVTEIEGPG